MEEEMKRQQGGSECTIRMQRKALFFFSAFLLLAHRRSVWDPVWSASMRSLQSPSTGACMYTVRDEERRYYQVEQVSINQPGKNTNKHKTVCVLLHVQYTNIKLLRRIRAHYLCLSLILAAPHIANLQWDLTELVKVRRSCLNWFLVLTFMNVLDVYWGIFPIIDCKNSTKEHPIYEHQFQMSTCD